MLNSRALRRRGAVLAIVLVLAGCGSAHSNATRIDAQGSVGTANTGEPDIAAIAARIARTDMAEGAKPPTSIEVVHTDRATVYKAMDEDWPQGVKNEAVLFAQMTGNFIGNTTHPPPGAELPTGTVIRFAINAETGQRTDFQLNDTPIDMAAFGKVETIPLPA